MILQGTVQGGRRRGRQKKRWEDNITEWTGLKLGEALRKAENREEWRTVVARSSLVPQRSNRLWDKWSEVKWSTYICRPVLEVHKHVAGTLTLLWWSEPSWVTLHVSGSLVSHLLLADQLTETSTTNSVFLWYPSRAEGPGFESRLRRDFFGVESYQWLKHWHSSGYPARRLAL